MTAGSDVARDEKRTVTRAFIVGCARSGTTLLQSLVAAHPRARSFPESHFFSWIGRSDIEAAAALINRFITQAGLTHLWSGETSMESRGELVEAFVELLDGATAEARCDVWIEKTPHHLHYISEIERAVPGARFLHILRNAPDTIRSLYRVTREHPDAWGGKRSIRRCTKRWIRDIRISLEYLDRPGHHLLRYETLTSNPEDTLRKVCRFLDLPFTSQMIDAHRAAADAVVSPGETWKMEAREDIRSAPRPATEIGDLKLDDDSSTRLATMQQALDANLPTR